MKEAVSFLWELMLRHWTFYFVTRRIQDNWVSTQVPCDAECTGGFKERRGEFLPCSHPTPALPTAPIYPQPDKPEGEGGYPTSSAELFFPKPWVATSSGFPFPG